MKIKKLLLTAAMALFCFTSDIVPISDANAVAKKNFIKTDGQILTEQDGTPYLIRGMAFGNNVWANPSKPPKNLHHTEKSYKELSEMGFNSVRFYINYGLFESDNLPYKYREEGFRWLDLNIKQAKKYGIRLLLNMHYPQGGFQSQGNGDALWLDNNNQKRLVALWTEIAERYKDEPTILGYGLVNEPVAAVKNSSEDGLKKWQELAQKITDGIRSQDKNHIIFVERLCAVKNVESETSEWKLFNDENNYVHIDDDNVVYEFHTYDPHMYTHQSLDWANTENYDYTYPDENLAVSLNAEWTGGTFGGGRANLSSDGWQYLESSFMSIDDDSNYILNLVFRASNLGENGIAYADNLKLDEYDKSGRFIRTLYYGDFSNGGGFGFWSSDKSGRGFVSDSVGYDDNASLCISGTTGDSNFGRGNIVAVKGHKYKASGYFKVENASPKATVMPRVDVSRVKELSVFNKDYLEKSIMENIKFSAENNVPVYCGEFGANTNCFKNDRGGVQWVSDIIDIFEENNISFNYHTYHEGGFGLYMNSPLEPPSDRNDALYELFVSKLAKYNKK